MAAGGSEPAPWPPSAMPEMGIPHQAETQSWPVTAQHDIYAVGLTAVFILPLSSVGMTAPSVGWSMRLLRQGASVTSVFSPSFHSLT